MPIAIIIAPDNIVPAIVAEETPAALVTRLRGFVFAPGLPDEQAARLWLQTLPEPSGWFADVAEARAHLARAASGAQDMTGSEVAEAREVLGLTRAELASAIGFGGNDNTRHKHIWEVETGQRRLNPDATRRLRALVAQRVAENG